MRDKRTAAFLSLFLGAFGLHQFYLRRPWLGFIFLLVFWRFGFFLAAMMGMINAFILFMMSDESFDRAYNRAQMRKSRYPSRRRHRPDFQRDQEPERKSQRRSIRRPENVSPPTRKNPYKTTGIKKYKEFELEEAIEDFKKAIEIDPRDVATHFNIACAYSLTEQKEHGFHHLERAVALGFRDFEKIKRHDDLAFLRIQPEFEDFEKNGFAIRKDEPVQETEEQENKIEGGSETENDVLLEQLNKLKALREKGFLTEEEFVFEKRKLMNK